MLKGRAKELLKFLMLKVFVRNLTRNFTMKLIMKTIVASVLVLGMGSAFANEPVALTETQMDNVTAGGTAVAGADALAWGLFGASTLTKAITSVQVLNALPVQGGWVTQDKTVSLSYSQGIAF